MQFRKHGARGFSLTELMVAATLGLIVLAATAGVPAPAPPVDAIITCHNYGNAPVGAPLQLEFDADFRDMFDEMGKQIDAVTEDIGVDAQAAIPQVGLDAGFVRGDGLGIGHRDRHPRQCAHQSPGGPGGSQPRRLQPLPVHAERVSPTLDEPAADRVSHLREHDRRQQGNKQESQLEPPRSVRRER